MKEHCVRMGDKVTAGEGTWEGRQEKHSSISHESQKETMEGGKKEIKRFAARIRRTL
jgi:hypothetical protein